ncbi:hypothetical protein WAI453_006898 [Rhynchosporium graminicola]
MRLISQKDGDVSHPRSTSLGNHLLSLKSSFSDRSAQSFSAAGNIAKSLFHGPLLFLALVLLVMILLLDMD